MAKTPYELRLELLDMAKGMLESEWYAKKERAMEQFFHERDYQKLIMTTVPELCAFPTSKEIIEMAATFNDFISATEK